MQRTVEPSRQDRMIGGAKCDLRSENVTLMNLAAVALAKEFLVSALLTRGGEYRRLLSAMVAEHDCDVREKLGRVLASMNPKHLQTLHAVALCNESPERIAESMNRGVTTAKNRIAAARQVLASGIRKEFAGVRLVESAERVKSRACRS